MVSIVHCVTHTTPLINRGSDEGKGIDDIFRNRTRAFCSCSSDSGVKGGGWGVIDKAVATLGSSDYGLQNRVVEEIYYLVSPSNDQSICYQTT